MKLFFITNSVELASFAVNNGVDRIFVDLEVLGKSQRQGHLDTVISRHSVFDVAALRPFVPRGGLLVRVNPLHDGTDEEIDRVIQAGADVVMLPMFRGPKDVEVFIRAVAGRARTSLLVETIGAMLSLHECVSLPGVDEVHIGLNDLHLELGMRFMFEPLADGLIDDMADILNRAEMPFGLGGVARVGEGLLPAELVLAEHVRLGSTAAILSRTFQRQAKTVVEIQSQMDFKVEIAKLRDAYSTLLDADVHELRRLQVEVNKRIRRISASMPLKGVVVHG